MATRQKCVVGVGSTPLEAMLASGRRGWRQSPVDPRSGPRHPGAFGRAQRCAFGRGCSGGRASVPCVSKYGPFLTCLTRHGYLGLSVDCQHPRPAECASACRTEACENLAETASVCATECTSRIAVSCFGREHLRRLATCPKARRRGRPTRAAGEFQRRRSLREMCRFMRQPRGIGTDQ